VPLVGADLDRERAVGVGDDVGGVAVDADRGHRQFLSVVPGALVASAAGVVRALMPRTCVHRARAGGVRWPPRSGGSWPSSQPGCRPATATDRHAAATPATPARPGPHATAQGGTGSGRP